MTLRARATIAAGAAVLVAVIAASVAVYLIVSANMHDQVDDSLRHRPVTQRLPHDPIAPPGSLPLVDDAYMQVVNTDGEVVMAFDDRPLPVTPEVLAVARGERVELYFDAEIDGTSVRVYVTSAEPGSAVMVGRSLTEVDQALRQLVIALTAIALVAVGLAALLGRLVAAAATAPVRRVATAAAAVARTGDLSHHIVVRGGDDLDRLAESFNSMLDALNDSLAEQRRLVADASHELRTPLATVRTNVEVLARSDELAPDDRAALIRDTTAQIGELTGLVGNLVELARGDGQEEPLSVVDLYEVTCDVVTAVRRNYPSIAFRVEGKPSMILGARGRVALAVSNLVDNAAKWSPPGAEVEIAVRDRAVSVRDHGPGVAPADRDRIFDRFYRSPEARTMPGSGLGLAIVKQVADSHSGTVTVASPRSEGALFKLRFPPIRGATAERAALTRVSADA